MGRRLFITYCSLLTNEGSHNIWGNTTVCKVFKLQSKQLVLSPLLCITFKGLPLLRRRLLSSDLFLLELSETARSVSDVSEDWNDRPTYSVDLEHESLIYFSLEKERRRAWAACVEGLAAVMRRLVPLRELLRAIHQEVALTPLYLCDCMVLVISLVCIKNRDIE